MSNVKFQIVRSFVSELQRIFRDPGVTVIFIVATLAYPLIYKALSYIEPLRHYYLIYVNEALMAAPIENSIPHMLALTAFMVASLCVAPRLHRALVYWNYPLK